MSRGDKIFMIRGGNWQGVIILLEPILFIVSILLHYLKTLPEFYVRTYCVSKKQLTFKA